VPFGKTALATTPTRSPTRDIYGGVADALLAQLFPLADKFDDIYGGVDDATMNQLYDVYLRSRPRPRPPPTRPPQRRPPQRRPPQRRPPQRRPPRSGPPSRPSAAPCIARPRRARTVARRYDPDAEARRPQLQKTVARPARSQCPGATIPPLRRSRPAQPELLRAGVVEDGAARRAQLALGRGREGWEQRLGVYPAPYRALINAYGRADRSDAADEGLDRAVKRWRRVAGPAAGPATSLAIAAL
jgi:hypothetical protein